jgi:hypothetical protein
MQESMTFKRGEIVTRPISLVDPLNMLAFDLGFRHWGVSIGNDTIVHVKFNKKRPSESTVAAHSVEVFADGLPVKVHESEHDAEEIAKNAESRIGDPWKFNLINNNCETFVQLCLSQTGTCQSYKNLVKMMAEILVGDQETTMDRITKQFNAGANSDLVSQIVKDVQLDVKSLQLDKEAENSALSDRNDVFHHHGSRYEFS